METNKEKTLTLAEVLGLLQELKGTDSKKGLVSEKLNMTTKFHLFQLIKILTDHQLHFDQVRNESIRTHGELDAQNNYTIVMKLKNDQDQEIVNPKFLQYEQEMKELLEQQISFIHPVFHINDFVALDSEGYYPLFFELLDAGVL